MVCCNQSVAGRWCRVSGAMLGRPCQREEKLLQTPWCCTAARRGEKKKKKQENQTGFSDPASGHSPEGAGSGLGPGPSGCNGWGAGGMAVGSAHICFEIISGQTDGQTDGLPEGQTHVPHRHRCPTALLLVPAPAEARPRGMPEALCTVTPSPLPKRYRVCLLSYFFNTR